MLYFYKSSAGSGKTYTLAKFYLELLLAHNHTPNKHESILALTFTNKAAFEMQERVLTHLTKLSKGEDSYYKKDLLKKFNINEQELQHRATKALLDIIKQPNVFNITTIDSFVNNVVEPIHDQLGFDFEFELMLDVQLIIDSYVGHFLKSFDTNNKLYNDAFLDIAKTSFDNQKSWNILHQIRTNVQEALSEKNYAYIVHNGPKLVENFYEINNCINTKINELSSKIEALFNEFVSFITSNVEYSDLTKNIQNTIVDKSTDKLFNPNKDTDKEEFKFFKNGTKSNTTPNNLHLTQIVKEGIDLKLNLAQYFDFKKGIDLLLIQNYFIEDIDRWVSQTRKVPLSLINYKLLKHIAHNPIYSQLEKHNINVRHILLDEAQDTSNVQWQILMPLFLDKLANNNDCLIVGDAKQSIYRFRGANPEVFAAFPAPNQDVLHADFYSFIQQSEVYKIEKLVNNFRSTHTIIDFNNRFYHLLQNQFELGTFFEDFHQQTTNNEIGYIKIDCYDKTESKKQAENDEEKDELAQNDANCIKALFENVSSLLAQGYPAHNIAVLCTKNDVVSQLATFFHANGIPINTSDGLLLKKSTRLQLILALSKWGLTADSNALFEIDFFLKLSYNANLEIDAPLIPDAVFEKLVAHGIHFETSVFNTLTYLEQKLYLCTVTASLADELFIATWLNETKYLTDWYSTWDWWNKAGREYKIDNQNKEGVNIMTIHKSKGLEFHTVFLFLNSQSKTPDSQIIWTDFNEHEFKLQLPIKVYQYNDVADIINQLYVATTRAIANLFITVIEHYKENEKRIDYQMLIKRFVSKFGDVVNEKHIVYEEGKLNLNGKPNAVAVQPEMVKPASNFNKALWNNSETILATRKGDYIHKLLQQIQTKADLPNVLQHVSNDIQDLLIYTVLHSAVAPYFQDGLTVYTEKEFAINGAVFRVDRVVVSNEFFHIIDFKTGKPNEKEHHLQLATYAKHLTLLQPLTVKASLYYIDEKCIINVI